VALVPDQGPVQQLTPIPAKVCGCVLRRVAAGFGEDIAPDAASAWG
jgi:hypothetical protein